VVVCFDIKKKPLSVLKSDLGNVRLYAIAEAVTALPFYPVSAASFIHSHSNCSLFLLKISAHVPLLRRGPIGGKP
jgi:hypothetical protein